ncbi:MAG: hypothetical protein AAGC82_13105 [Pseudomonadota bacterium]
MIPYRMELDYALRPGWLGPFLVGLCDGEAVARKCRDCAAVSYPPLRMCRCGGRNGDWVRLSGRAEVICRTGGADGAFALARFDGADGMAVVQLQDFPEEARVGQLAIADPDLPCISLVPLGGGAA